VGLSHSWQATSRSATQDFPNSLWSLNVNYRVYKSPLLDPLLRQMNPVHTIPSYILGSILILSSHLRLDLSSGLFLCGFPTKILYVFLFSPMRATCIACSYHAERNHYSTPSWIVRGQSWLGWEIRTVDPYRYVSCSVLYLYECTLFSFQFRCMLCP
jgi:hypothetical protein